MMQSAPFVQLTAPTNIAEPISMHVQMDPLGSVSNATLDSFSSRSSERPMLESFPTE